MFKRVWVAAAITFVAAGAQAQALVNEGFENVAGLAAAGWTFNNLSSPVGSTTWAPGVADPVDFFFAQSGSDGSYISANFNNGVDGGTLDNRMATPTFSLEAAGTVTFWARAVVEAPYFDTIRYGIDTGTGVTGSFSSAVLSAEWTQYSVDFAAAATGSTGRFLISYAGLASNANYIGIDTLAVTVAAVPEPASLALLAAGLLGVGFRARRLGAGLVLAGAAALPAQAGTADAAAPATDSNAQVVVRDAETGKLRAATAEEARTLTSKSDGLRRAPIAPLAKTHASGARGMRLNDAAMSYSVIVRQPDGRLVEQCFDSQEAADAAVKAASVAKSNILPTE